MSLVDTAPVPSLTERQSRLLERYWKSAGTVHRALCGSLARATRSALGRAVAKGQPNALKYLVREKVRAHAGNAAFRAAVCDKVKWGEIGDRRDMSLFADALPDLVQAFRGEAGGGAIVVYAIQNRIFDDVCRALASKR